MASRLSLFAREQYTLKGEKAPREDIFAALADGRAAAAILFSSGEAFSLLTGMGLADCVSAMHHLSDLYATPPVRGTLGGSDPLDSASELLARHPETNVCIVFSQLSQRDVITLAQNMRTELPAGITRFIVNCGRVLNSNAPLSLLQDDRPAKEKTARLIHMLSRRLRVYAEPTPVYEDD